MLPAPITANSVADWRAKPSSTPPRFAHFVVVVADGQNVQRLLRYPPHLPQDGALGGQLDALGHVPRTRTDAVRQRHHERRGQMATDTALQGRRIVRPVASRRGDGGHVLRPCVRSVASKRTHGSTVHGSGHGQRAMVAKKRRSTSSVSTSLPPSWLSSQLQNDHSIVHHAEPPGNPYLEP